MMLKNTARFFSFSLHPLFMPLAGITILLFTGSYVSLLPLAARKLIILLFASGTLLLPALMIPFSYFRMELAGQNQNERNLPMVFTFIFYLITYVLFLKVPVYAFMHSYMLAGVICVFAALLITLRWKISLHMISLGALTAFLLMLALTKQINLLPWLLISILASGIAGTSRLYLGSHSPSQIYVGYLLGASVMSGCIYLF